MKTYTITGTIVRQKIQSRVLELKVEAEDEHDAEDKFYDMVSEGQSTYLAEDSNLWEEDAEEVTVEDISDVVCDEEEE